MSQNFLNIRKLLRCHSTFIILLTEGIILSQIILYNIDISKHILSEKGFFDVLA